MQTNDLDGMGKKSKTVKENCGRKGGEQQAGWGRLAFAILATTTKK